ncbi:hypothetical protein N781_05690 [Pontibacillus halophilus JSM 076056 = DSM 19796]|uniref:Peptidase S54 rhomboid domain-containing protein n=1 Tax=Pontibacillus halophilus JSM 076056 = DSM 19796 TaxID=1385510 RepID=A0A0A5GFR6_9BACI|nr:rhomboid family intramembrane serine protease [Pontibacillus halophilus]KGX90864.1 hypothetical protein N781_05690 [Pontibacillus halophilus JSM 076056 = DSM 19796]
MYIEEQFRFWQIVGDLIVNHDFELVRLDENQQVVWMEKSHKNKTHIVRVIQRTFDWSNQLKQDHQLVMKQASQLQRKLRGRKLEFHNVYIASEQPVDEWHEVKQSKTVDGKKDNWLHTYYTTEDSREEQFSTLYSNVGLENRSFQKPETVTEMEQTAAYTKQSVYNQHHKRKKKQQELFQTGKPIFTYAFLAIIVLMFAWMEYTGSSLNTQHLIDFGAKYNPAIVDGEWWRFVTSMFLHIGFVHFALNSLALYYIGNAVERMYGSWRFVVIYMLSGVIGSLTSFALTPSVSAGASGAIYGLFGALLFFGVVERKLFLRTIGPNLIFILIINIAFSVVSPQIDNGAHFGGLAAGFLVSMMLHLPKRRKWSMQILALLVLLIGSIGILSFGLGSQPGVQQANELLEQERYEEAIELTTEKLQSPMDQYKGELYFTRSYAYIKTGEFEKAQQDLEKSIRYESNTALSRAHYNLALLESDLGNQDKALQHARKALELEPDNEDMESLVQSLE